MESSTSNAPGADDTGAVVSWSGQALTLTAAIAVVANIVGVLLAPGMRGVVSEPAVVAFETLSATLAYTLVALLVALVCASSFELARIRGIGVAARGTVVAISGLVVALASPAVVTRLPTPPTLVLAVTTAVVALIGGLVAVRAPHTRAVGAILALLGVCALLRLCAWQLAAIGSERPSPALHDAGRGLATAAVGLHAVGILLAAAWLGTRSRVRGRFLANASIFLAFVVTYVAVRNSEAPPSSIEAVVRASLLDAAGVPAPFALASVAAFLVPASIFLAGAALLQRTGRPAVMSALVLVLLAHGSFDVPIHALAAAASAQWLMLAMADERSVASTLPRRSAEQRNAA